MGRIDREVELGDEEEDTGERWRHHEDNETQGKNEPIVTQFFIKQHPFSIYIFSFIEQEKSEIE